MVATARSAAYATSQRYEPRVFSHPEVFRYAAIRAERSACVLPLPTDVVQPRPLRRAITSCTDGFSPVGWSSRTDTSKVMFCPNFCPSELIPDDLSKSRIAQGGQITR
jgi:hypothetical protein